MPEDLGSAPGPTVVQMGQARKARRGHGQAGFGEFPVGTGSLCLDLVATTGGPYRLAADLLASPELLGEWLQGPGLPAPAGGVTDADLGDALELRGAIARLARSIITGRPGSPADVRCINSFARHPTPVFLLRPGGGGRTLIPEVDLASALAVIARDAIHLLAGPDVRRLRECARDGCTTLFFDRSPSGRRRWCSMKGCGEMVASASYRRRHSTEVSP
jgi:hypothetical protein